MDINKKLKETRLALYALGQKRENRGQQVDFLLDLVARFQEIMGNAVRGNYGTDDIFDKVQDFRLATTVIDRNEQFRVDMANMGHVYRFRKDNDTHPAAKAKTDCDLDDGHVSTRKIDTKLDINDALTDPELVMPPIDDDILQWLEREYLGSRGFEFGTFNTSLLPTVMKKQSSKWGSIALGYTSDIIALVNAFMVSVLTDLCGNGRISRGLLAIMGDDLQKKYALAVQHTQFLLDNERNDTLLSLHQSFTDTLQCRLVPFFNMIELIWQP